MDEYLSASEQLGPEWPTLLHTAFHTVFVYFLATFFSLLQTKFVFCHYYGRNNRSMLTWVFFSKGSCCLFALSVLLFKASQYHNYICLCSEPCLRHNLSCRYLPETNNRSFHWWKKHLCCKAANMPFYSIFPASLVPVFVAYIQKRLTAFFSRFWWGKSINLETFLTIFNNSNI